MTNPLIAARDAFAAQYPEQRIAVNGREWGVLSLGGSGPALVLLPGTLGRGDVFWQQIAALKDRARVLALTYPVEGTLKDWCGDICTLMSATGMARATVLGSSLGGYIAQYLAATRPERVERLIAANTLHSAAMVAQFPPYSSDLEAVPAEALVQGVRDSMEAWAAQEPAQAEVAAFLTEEISRRISGEELRARLKALKHAPELPDVPHPRSHIFTVESADDRLIPPPIREAVRARLDPVENFSFPAGSHFPYLLHGFAYAMLIAKAMDVKGQKQ